MRRSHARFRCISSRTEASLRRLTVGFIRGIKTLAVRMDRHNENAKKVAEWLRAQPKVKEVYYVGFADQKDIRSQRRRPMDRRHYLLYGRLL